MDHRRAAWESSATSDGSSPEWWWADRARVGAAAAVSSRRGADRSTPWLVGFLIFGMAVAIVSVSNVVDLLYPYLTRWTWVFGPTLGILLLRGLARGAHFWSAGPRAPVGDAGVGRHPGRARAMETVDALNAGTRLAAEQGAGARDHARGAEYLPPGTARCSSTRATAASWRRDRARARAPRHPDRGGARPGRRLRRRPHRRVGPYRAKLVPVLGDDAIHNFKPTGPASPTTSSRRPPRIGAPDPGQPGGPEAPTRSGAHGVPEAAQGRGQRTGSRDLAVYLAEPKPPSPRFWVTRPRIGPVKTRCGWWASGREPAEHERREREDERPVTDEAQRRAVHGVAAVMGGAGDAARQHDRGGPSERRSRPTRLRAGDQPG